VFENPLRWSDFEAVAVGSEVTFDAGNVNATVIKGTHYLAFYSGKMPDMAILVSVIHQQQQTGQTDPQGAVCETAEPVATVTGKRCCRLTNPGETGTPVLMAVYHQHWWQCTTNAGGILSLTLVAVCHSVGKTKG
jgi:hypothetical protein